MLRSSVLSFLPPKRVLFLFVLLLANAARAQTFRGGINGSVTDSSGAAIPNAAVQAVDNATGVMHSTLSSSASRA